MNLGQRIAGALAALSGNLSAEVLENAAADDTFRGQTEATLAGLGEITTGLKAGLDALQAQVDAGAAIDPAAFAEIKSKVDSLDAAFPDSDASPPEADDDEDPIEDDGSAPVE